MAGMPDKTTDEDLEYLDVLATLFTAVTNTREEKFTKWKGLFWPLVSEPASRQKIKEEGHGGQTLT